MGTPHSQPRTGGDYEKTTFLTTIKPLKERKQHNQRVARELGGNEQEYFLLLLSGMSNEKKKERGKRIKRKAIVLRESTQ